MRRLARLAALLVWALLCVCSRAHAYQNPARFSDPPEMGGGGGKYFTGSPADGYTCRVCHSDGTAAHVKIMGLPVKGYVPGQTYRVTVDWDDALKSVGLDLEVTNRTGQVMGMLASATPAELNTGDLCEPIMLGLPDLQVVTLPDKRMIGLVGECGGHQASFDWTAPTNPGATLTDAEAWFSGSLVAADGDGKVFGDNVTDFTHVVGLRGTAQPSPSTLSSSCGVSGPRKGASLALVLWPAWLSLLLLRARRRAPAQR